MSSAYYPRSDSYSSYPENSDDYYSGSSDRSRTRSRSSGDYYGSGYSYGDNDSGYGYSSHYGSDYTYIPRYQRRSRPTTYRSSNIRSDITNQHGFNKCRSCNIDPTCETCYHYEFVPAQCGQIKTSYHPFDAINALSYEKYYYFGVPEFRKDTGTLMHARFDKLVPCKKGLKILEIGSDDTTKLDSSSYATDEDYTSQYDSEYELTAPLRTTYTSTSSITEDTKSFASKSVMAQVALKNVAVNYRLAQRTEATNPDEIDMIATATSYSGTKVRDFGNSASHVKLVNETTSISLGPTPSKFTKIDKKVKKKMISPQSSFSKPSSRSIHENTISPNNQSYDSYIVSVRESPVKGTIETIPEMEEYGADITPSQAHMATSATTVGESFIGIEMPLLSQEEAQPQSIPPPLETNLPTTPKPTPLAPQSGETIAASVSSYEPGKPLKISKRVRHDPGHPQPEPKPVPPQKSTASTKIPVLIKSSTPVAVPNETPKITSTSVPSTPAPESKSTPPVAVPNKTPKIKSTSVPSEIKSSSVPSPIPQNTPAKLQVTTGGVTEIEPSLYSNSGSSNSPSRDSSTKSSTDSNISIGGKAFGGKATEVTISPSITPQSSDLITLESTPTETSSIKCIPINCGSTYNLQTPTNTNSPCTAPVTSGISKSPSKTSSQSKILPESTTSLTQYIRINCGSTYKTENNLKNNACGKPGPVDTSATVGYFCTETAMDQHSMNTSNRTFQDQATSKNTSTVTIGVEQIPIIMDQGTSIHPKNSLLMWNNQIMQTLPMCADAGNQSPAFIWEDSSLFRLFDEEFLRNRTTPTSIANKPVHKAPSLQPQSPPPDPSQFIDLVSKDVGECSSYPMPPPCKITVKDRGIQSVTLPLQEDDMVKESLALTIPVHNIYQPSSTEIVSSPEDTMKENCNYKILKAPDVSKTTGKRLGATSAVNKSTKTTQFKSESRHRHGSGTESEDSRVRTIVYHRSKEGRSKSSHRRRFIGEFSGESSDKTTKSSRSERSELPSSVKHRSRKAKKDHGATSKIRSSEKSSKPTRGSSFELRAVNTQSQVNDFEVYRVDSHKNSAKSASSTYIRIPKNKAPKINAFPSSRDRVFMQPARKPRKKKPKVESKKSKGSVSSRSPSRRRTRTMEPRRSMKSRETIRPMVESPSVSQIDKPSQTDMYEEQIETIEFSSPPEVIDSPPNSEPKIQTVRYCTNDTLPFLRQVFGPECETFEGPCCCTPCTWDYLRRPEVLSVFVFTAILLINGILELMMSQCML